MKQIGGGKKPAASNRALLRVKPWVFRTIKLVAELRIHVHAKCIASLRPGEQFNDRKKIG
jgi:hypothetical protein